MDTKDLLAGLSPFETAAFSLNPKKLLLLASKHTDLFRPKERALALLYMQKYVSSILSKERKNIESLA